MTEPISRDREAGFTLIELVVVIILFAVVSTVAVGHFNSLVGWRHKTDIRKLLSTWEFLTSQAQASGKVFRLYLDIDRNGYYVREEVPLRVEESRDVDYLANLRTKGEKKRRAKKDTEDLLTLDEELERRDEQDGLPLNTLFFRFILTGPSGSVRLSRPIDYPSLAEISVFPPDLKIIDVKVRGEKFKDGSPFIRIARGTGSEFAVIHLLPINPDSNAMGAKEIDESAVTLFNDPAQRRFMLRTGYVDLAADKDDEDRHKLKLE